ncbi:MAG: tetratricopeptide repeat protein [Candidatus Thorarchaeota archaeon]|jgi:tetratricopeptide (TPR) repeat protein
MDSIDDSLRAVDKHLENNPDDASAWNAKGVFHAQKREFGEAIRCLDRALGLQPDLTLAHANRGRVLLALGPEKASDALQSFEKALSQTPDDIEILRDKAAALHTLGRTKDELESYRRLSELVAYEWGVWVRIGDIELELGNFDSAILNYDKALELSNDLVPAFVRRAIALAMLERWKEAIKSAETATKLDPENSEAWLIRGDVNLRAGKHKSAMKALKKASELEPEDATVENTMGMVSYKDGKLKEAVKHLRRALIRKKNYPAAMRNLGLISMELEDWEEAAKAFSGYVLLVKNDPDMFDAKATAYARLDDFCTAEEAWDQARKLYKKSGNSAEVERVTVLGRSARINCSRQKKADKERREKERSQRRFSDRHEIRRKKERRKK